MKNLDKDIEKVLIDAVKIQERVCEMGAQITKDYEGRELVLVGVLKGAMPFLCDLMRAIDLPLTIDTMVVSSYGNDTVSSGSIHIRKDLDKEIQGKNVLVVEDIIDTGITLSLLVPFCPFAEKEGGRFCRAGSVPEQEGTARKECFREIRGV